MDFQESKIKSHWIEIDFNRSMPHGWTIISFDRLSKDFDKNINNINGFLEAVANEINIDKSRIKKIELFDDLSAWKFYYLINEQNTLLSNEINSDIGNVAENKNLFVEILDLFQWILPKNIRERVYTPSHMEIKYEYLYAMDKYEGKWVRRWLMVCFGFRTVLLVIDSFRVLFADKAFGFLVRGLPKPVKRWWMS